MPELAEPFALLPDALGPADIDYLRQACKTRLERDGIPCFALIDHHDSPTYLKIKRALEAHTGAELNYLNDFYIYTDDSFKTNWHMDTELFTFESAINAWILLSPEQIENPLGFIPDLNGDPERYYHSVAIQGDECTFRNYRTGKTEARPLRAVEDGQVRTPVIRVGDILALNPTRFHKTNVDTPKHAFALKFVYGSRKGCLSARQVPSMFWPEVKTFNDVIKKSGSWEDVVEGLRAQLQTADGRVKLSSGFYPEKFDLYKRMVQRL
jgi:hypothetical protein